MVLRAKEVQIRNSVVEVSLYKVSRDGRKEFDVILKKGPWPPIVELYMVCDGAAHDTPWRDRLFHSETWEKLSPEHLAVSFYSK